MEDRYILIKGNGPILITAPHVVVTMRNGKNHAMERHILPMVLKLYDILGDKCTLVTWDRKKIRQDKKRLSDPNFKKENEHSSWFQKIKSLHKKRKFLLHLDFHGMDDETTSNNLDIGLGYKFSKRYTKQIRKKLRKVILSEFEKIDDKTGISQLFRGGGCLLYKTLTSRTRKLNIFSLQLEISKLLRKKIAKSNKKLHLLAQIILNIHKKINYILKNNQGKLKNQKTKLKNQKTKKKSHKITRKKKHQTYKN
jgi:hypothetical protein